MVKLPQLFNLLAVSSIRSSPLLKLLVEYFPEDMMALQWPIIWASFPRNAPPFGTSQESSVVYTIFPAGFILRMSRLKNEGDSME
ncbi:hypothetical protein D3C86_1894980 [compost metagenome]